MTRQEAERSQTRYVSTIELNGQTLYWSRLGWIENPKDATIYTRSEVDNPRFSRPALGTMKIFQEAQN